MKLCQRNLSDCAGSEYFKYQLEHYILYGGAFELEILVQIMDINVIFKHVLTIQTC